MSRVLAFSDEHLPATIPGRVKFLKEMEKRWKCDTIVCTGDFLDLHAISSHTTEADAKGALDEMDEALIMAKEYYKAFPKVTLILGNHDLRIMRAANEAKLPKNWLRSFREIIGAPEGWDIRTEPIIIDNVLYDHDFQCSGMNAHRSRATKEGLNVVGGHLHAFGGISFISNSHSLTWGMNIGSGVDDTAYHMRYGKKFPNKAIVGAGIIIDGFYPYFEPMNLGSKRKLTLSRPKSKKKKVK